jgi:hypothetical protein
LRKQWCSRPPAHTGARLAQLMLCCCRGLSCRCRKLRRQLLATRRSAAAALHVPSSSFMAQPMTLVDKMAPSLPHTAGFTAVGWSLPYWRPAAISAVADDAVAAAHCGFHPPWVGRHLASTADFTQAAHGALLHAGTGQANQHILGTWLTIKPSRPLSSLAAHTAAREAAWHGWPWGGNHVPSQPP